MEQIRMVINGESTVSMSGRWMDSENPFSGDVWAQDSGVGRENGIDAVKEYPQVKSIRVNTGAPIPNPYAPR